MYKIDLKYKKELINHIIKNYNEIFSEQEHLLYNYYGDYNQAHVCFDFSLDKFIVSYIKDKDILKKQFSYYEMLETIFIIDKYWLDEHIIDLNICGEKLGSKYLEDVGEFMLIKDLDKEILKDHCPNIMSLLDKNSNEFLYFFT